MPVVLGGDFPRQFSIFHSSFEFATDCCAFSKGVRRALDIISNFSALLLAVCLVEPEAGKDSSYHPATQLLSYSAGSGLRALIQHPLFRISHQLIQP
jgi:hypothetical protein